VFVFNSLHDLTSLNLFSLIKVIAFLLLLNESKFSVKFSLEFNKYLFLIKFFEILNLLFFSPFTLQNSQIEFQKFFEFLMLHVKSLSKFFEGI